MSRKLLALLVAAMLLLTLATYVYYRRTLAAVPVDAYALVPDDAVFVLSTHNHPALVRHLEETQLWDNLTAVRYFQQAAGHVALADSLAGGRRQGGLLAFLGRKLVVTSMHVTGRHEFDVLYQVPLARVSEYRQARAVLEALGRDARYRLSRRDYEGHELTVLTERGSELSITVLNYRNHIIISANPALVEAVVRRTQHPDAPTVLAPFRDTDLLKLRDIDASLLVNYRRLPGFLDVLLQEGTHGEIDLLAGLASEGLLGLRLAGSRTEMVGFSNPETARGSLHRHVVGQPAQPVALAPLLSLRTALVLHLAAAPARAWPLNAPAPALAALPPASSPPANSPAPAAPPAVLTTPAALDSLQRSLGPEMALVYVAAPTAGSRPGRLAFVRCPRPARTARWLGELRRLAGASPAFTRVGPYEVRPIAFDEAAVLGPLLSPAAPDLRLSNASGREVSTLVDNYLVLSDNKTLTTYLTDLAAGHTWGKTPSQVAFLEQTLPRARLSVFVDTRNSWNALLGALTEERRAGLLRNETLFMRFPQLALQLAPDASEAVPGTQYYTQLLLWHPDQNLAANPEVAATGSRLAFVRGLAGQPTLLPAAGTRVPAVVVQDSAGVLHFVSAENTLVWSDSLGAPAVGVQLLPAAPAGGSAPLALLLGAGNRLHLLGADGREQVPYPFIFPDSVRLGSLQAAPDPNGAPPRLLSVSGGNTLRLLDARGRQYPGWQPKVLDVPLAGEPALISLRSRDVVVVPLQNGYVYAYDQRGDRLPGFPLSMGARLGGGLLAEPGATLGSTRVTLVNQHGELITFSLSGDISRRRRLSTWSRTARFRLVPDQRHASFVVVREEEGRLDVFSPRGGPALLSKTFLTSGPKPVQLFDFGRGHRVLAITEPGPGQVYLFDGQGQALGNEPLPSTGTGVGLSFDGNSGTYQLVRLLGRELRRTDFK